MMDRSRPTSRSGALMLEALSAKPPKQVKPPKIKPGMAFEAALSKLRKGKMVRRRAWHRQSFIFRLGKDVFVHLPEALTDAPQKWRPYSQDFLAADWEVQHS